MKGLQSKFWRNSTAFGLSVLLAGWVTWIPAFAGMTTAPEMSSALLDQLASLHRFSADFEQIVRNPDGTELERSSGKVAFERPGLFSWKTTSPWKQTILIDGKKVWVEDPDLEEITVRPLGSEIEGTPVALLTEPHPDLARQFVITVLDSQRLQWIPRSKAVPYEKIVLSWVEGALSRMVCTTAGGPVIEIRLSHVQQNADDRHWDQGQFAISPSRSALEGIR